jgi:hypothetical protein
MTVFTIRRIYASQVTVGRSLPIFCKNELPKNYPSDPTQDRDVACQG